MSDTPEGDLFEIDRERYYILTTLLAKLRIVTHALHGAAIGAEDVVPEDAFRDVVAKLANWEQDVYIALTGDEDDRVYDDEDESDRLR